MLGNGPSLNDVSIGLLNRYTSIGSNTIFRSVVMPTYYTAIDTRVRLEFSEEINEKYRHIPKFIPTPNLDKWEGENIFRFFHRPGPLWPYADTKFPANLLDEEGITFSCVMHVQMQLAFFMGFTTMLIVGMDHTVETKEHFWGRDDDQPGSEDSRSLWAKGYKELRERMNVRMLNISSYTTLPPEVIPIGDWRNYA